MDVIEAMAFGHVSGEAGAWQALRDAIERLRGLGYSKRAIACALVAEKSLD